MTCAQFIKRLSGLNDGGNFPVDLLRRLYMAIKGKIYLQQGTLILASLNL